DALPICLLGHDLGGVAERVGGLLEVSREDVARVVGVDGGVLADLLRPLLDARGEGRRLRLGDERRDEAADGEAEAGGGGDGEDGVVLDPPPHLPERVGLVVVGHRVVGGGGREDGLGRASRGAGVAAGRAAGGGGALDGAGRGGRRGHGLRLGLDARVGRGGVGGGGRLGRRAGVGGVVGVGLGHDGEGRKARGEAPDAAVPGRGYTVPPPNCFGGWDAGDTKKPRVHVY